MEIIPKFEVKLVRNRSQKYDIKTKRIKSTQDATEFGKRVCARMLLDSPNERVLCVALSTKSEVIGITEITSGTLDASLVHPREFFRPAILQNASSAIIVHNHPSGDLTPSTADFSMMNRLETAGENLGITLLDSLIVADENAISMKQEGC